MLISVATFAQKNINKYKFIIVDKQFDYVKQPDKYQTSSLTKFLFNKEGFQAFIEGENLPEEVMINRCLSLKATVIDDSKMLTTKSKIQLKDCFGNVVFTSLEGRSKQKDYKKAYQEAIRNAFESVKGLNYKYKELSSKKGGIVQDESKPSKMIVKEKDNNEEKNPFGNKIAPVLYANKRSDGFQLNNVKNKQVFTLLQTKLQDVFIIREKNGIFYKKNNRWLAEFYNSKGVKVVEEYDVIMND